MVLYDFWIASSFLLAMTMRVDVIASLRSNPETTTKTIDN